jgi:hypothetical protein
MLNLPIKHAVMKFSYLLSIPTKQNWEGGQDHRSRKEIKATRKTDKEIKKKEIYKLNLTLDLYKIITKFIYFTCKHIAWKV